MFHAILGIMGILGIIWFAVVSTFNRRTLRSYVRMHGPLSEKELLQNIRRYKDIQAAYRAASRCNLTILPKQVDRLWTVKIMRYENHLIYLKRVQKSENPSS